MYTPAKAVKQEKFDSTVIFCTVIGIYFNKGSIFASDCPLYLSIISDSLVVIRYLVGTPALASLSQSLKSGQIITANENPANGLDMENSSAHHLFHGE
jgi:hypothetical protein